LRRKRKKDKTSSVKKAKWSSKKCKYKSSFNKGKSNATYNELCTRSKLHPSPVVDKPVERRCKKQ